MSAAMSAVRFDRFEADLRSRELRSGGSKVTLQDQPFRILELLLAAPGEIVTREELVAAIWPSGTFVDFDRSVNTAMNKLRAALGDSAEGPRFIETVGRRGYRFIGSVEIQRTDGASDSSPRRILLAVGAILAVLLIIVVAAAILRHSPTKATITPPRIHSLAVLPLANLSKDPEQEFFADGMTDQLITSLAKAGGVDVISHQSVNQFKASRLSLPQIARQLGVEAVVEGTVARNGQRVRVSAQLIDARTDRHLWANDYEGEIGDVLSLQDDVARDIAEQVGAKLVGAPSSAAQPRPTTDAYLLYLRGLYEWNKLPPNFGPATEFFEQAIKQDPKFAPAYAGLADCYATRAGWNNIPYLESDKEKARALARRALELNPSLAEPYATLGGLDTQACQYVAAEGDFRRAIAANTNYIIGHQWYALLLSRLGRCEEAVREGRIAQQLDPLSPYAKGTLALALECSGRTAEAIDSRRTIARLFPDDANQHFHLFYLLHSLKRDDEAIRELSLGLTQSGFAPLASRVQTSFPTTGVNGAVRMYLHDPAISREDSRWSQARMHALLGDREATLTNLERSYATHGNIAFLNVTPEFEFVRDDPRFRELLLKLRLIAPAAQ